MKKAMKLFFAILLGLGIFNTTVFADVDKGQKIFSNEMRKICGFSGNVMARKHKQNEWKNIFESGKLNEELIKECPGVKPLKDADLLHFYDFLYNYALDSGNSAKC